MSNEEILLKLQTIGLKMQKQQLSKIFSNPFYCGLVAHGMLNGKVVEGKHEQLISKEVFLRVNEIKEARGLCGIPHERENNNLPLRVFVKCDSCGAPFTGYIVQKKKLYYYKCRTTGCKCNKSAKEMHSLFQDMLSQYSVRKELIKPVQYELEYAYRELNKGNEEKEKFLKEQLAEINTKLNNIEEQYYALNEMDSTTFQKFHTRYVEEKNAATKELGKSSQIISNHELAIEKALNISSNLNTMWELGDIKKKERLQKLVFPDGIYYTREKGAFRTERVNSVFALIASLSGSSEEKKKGQTTFLSTLSPSAERGGFEPPFRSPENLFSRQAHSTTLASLLISQINGIFLPFQNI